VTKSLDTATWFDTTARANFERHLMPLADRALDCLQLGAFTGDASVWIMENLPNALLVDVDTWAGSEEHHDFDFEEVWRTYSERTRGYRRAGRLSEREMTTDAFLRTRRGVDRFDFIYVDADHRAPAVLADAVLAWPLLRPGGLMAFDDYVWASSLGPLHAPHHAVDAFITVYAEQLRVVERNAQLWVRKT
jgi:predicted O-methyltransferase YrrM